MIKSITARQGTAQYSESEGGRMSMAEREYTLDAAAVDAISEAAAAYMEAQEIERMNLLRIRLAMEEMLLQLQSQGVESCTVRMGKRLGVRQIVIRYGGAALNPVREADDWGGRLMADLGLSPEWRYRGGVNELRFRLPRASGRSRLFYLGIAAAAQDLFLDLLATGFDLLQIDVELLREAEILDEIDRSVLHPAETSAV